MSKPNDERTNVEKALEAWGDPLPDWVRVLAEECDATSQGKACARLGYKGGAVASSVIGKNYKGNLDHVEQRVRGALMNVTVECPVLGELPKDKCITFQRRKLSPTSNQSVRLYRTCPTCEHGKYRG